MLRTSLAVSLVLSLSSAVAGQSGGPIGGTPGGIVTPPSIPVILPNYGYSNSAFDRQGNLLVMDVTYSYETPLPGTPVIQRLIPVAKTRVTVVSKTGTPLASREFDGTLSVLGTGRYAVYAVLSSYSVRTASGLMGLVPTATTSRRLLALRSGADGNIPISPPGMDLADGVDAKLSVSDEIGVLDTIALVGSPSGPRILMRTESSGSVSYVFAPRTVHLFRSDGISFTPVTANPVPLQE